MGAYDDLQLTFDKEIPIDVELEISGNLELTIEEGSGGTLPYFNGPYNVTPRKVEQILETKNKSMRDDVTVEEIPYSEVSNPQGGITATIGYE